MNKNAAEQKVKKLYNDINRHKTTEQQIKALAEMIYTLSAFIFTTSK